MPDQEPIPDHILLIQPDPPAVCGVCHEPVIGERFAVPNNRNIPYITSCAECYAAYVKAKFGSRNTNPDDIQII